MGGIARKQRHAIATATQATEARRHSFRVDVLIPSPFGLLVISFHLAVLANQAPTPRASRAITLAARQKPSMIRKDRKFASSG